MRVHYMLRLTCPDTDYSCASIEHLHCVLSFTAVDQTAVERACPEWAYLLPSDLPRPTSYSRSSRTWWEVGWRQALGHSTTPPSALLHGCRASCAAVPHSGGLTPSGELEWGRQRRCGVLRPIKLEVQYRCCMSSARCSIAVTQHQAPIR